MANRNRFCARPAALKVPTGERSSRRRFSKDGVQRHCGFGKGGKSPESASSAWRQIAIRLCIRNQLRPVMVRVRVFRFDIEDNRSLQINEVIVRIGEGR